MINIPYDQCTRYHHFQANHLFQDIQGNRLSHLVCQDYHCYLPIHRRSLRLMIHLFPLSHLNQLTRHFHHHHRCHDYHDLRH